MRRAWRSRVEEPNDSIYCRFSVSSLRTSDFLSFVVSCGAYSVLSRSHSVILEFSWSVSVQHRQETRQKAFNSRAPSSKFNNLSIHNTDTQWLGRVTGSKALGSGRVTGQRFRPGSISAILRVPLWLRHVTVKGEQPEDDVTHGGAG